MQETQQYNVNRTFSHDSVTVGARSGYANMLPREKARFLIREIIWWHNKFGNDVTFEDIFSRSRARQIALARGDCVRRVREVMRWSFPQLGKFFGLDYSTCIHHCQKKNTARAEILPRSWEGQQKFERARVIQLAQEPNIEWRICAERPTYEVSSNGLVRNVRSQIMLPQKRDLNGHYYVVFNGWSDSVDRTHAVRILVADAFIGPWEWGKNVIHLDGNRYNNRASNLAYVGTFQGVQVPRSTPKKRKRDEVQPTQPVL